MNGFNNFCLECGKAAHDTLETRLRCELLHILKERTAKRQDVDQHSMTVEELVNELTMSLPVQVADLHNNIRSTLRALQEEHLVASTGDEYSAKPPSLPFAISHEGGQLQSLDESFYLSPRYTRSRVTLHMRPKRLNACRHFLGCRCENKEIQTVRVVEKTVKRRRKHIKRQRPTPNVVVRRAVEKYLASRSTKSQKL